MAQMDTDTVLLAATFNQVEANEDEDIGMTSFRNRTMSTFKA